MRFEAIHQPLPAERFTYDPAAPLETNLQAAGYEFRGDSSVIKTSRRLVVRVCNKRVVGEMTMRETGAWLMALSAARATFKFDTTLAEVSRFDLLPDLCMVYDKLNEQGIVIKLGDEGYFPRPGTTPDYVRRFNQTMGVIPRQAEAMHIGSMFGWHVAGADPRCATFDNLPVLY